ncbi:MAG: DNA-processing protein DprA [Pirellulales bacterium]
MHSGLGDGGSGQFEKPPADLDSALRLALIPGVGPRLRQLLLQRFETPLGVLAAAPSELRGVQGIGPKLANAILDAHKIDVAGEIELCQRHNLRILVESDPAYPRLLREIPDPPGVIFQQGQLLPQDALAIAIVGSRHASVYGLQQAERLAASLSRAGLTIISGLARGVDGAAHRGTLAAGGRTIAVLGSGVLNIYPPEHKKLAEEVAAQGAVLSEAPPLAAPIAGVFPQRNRIISALSLGVIVVEASDRSGALITARHAMEQGRDVFAVPGRVDSRMSRGPHRLIRDGAKLIESADDVLEELGPLVEATSKGDGQKVHHPAELLLNEPEQQVLAAVRSDTTTIDEIIAACQLASPQVLSTLTVLEMRRLIRRVSGFAFIRL